MPFRLAVVQFAPKKGDFAGNIDRVANLALEAANEGADVCVFPEASATGYILEGGVREHAVSPQHLLDTLRPKLESLPRPLDLLIGFYETTDGQPHNSAAYLTIGGGAAEVVHVYRKFFLPTYGVFDEERFHTRGDDIGVFDTRFGRFGVLICADVWHSVLSTLCAVAGAEVLLVPTASPARGFANESPGNVSRYERMLKSVSEEHGMFTAASMLTGFEGGKGFTGGSFVIDPQGNKVVQCPLLEEAMVVADIDLETVRRVRNNLPLLGDLRGVWHNIVALASTLDAGAK